MSRVTVTLTTAAAPLNQTGTLDGSAPHLNFHIHTLLLLLILLHCCRIFYYSRLSLCLCLSVYLSVSIFTKGFHVPCSRPSPLQQSVELVHWHSPMCISKCAISDERRRMEWNSSWRRREIETRSSRTFIGWFWGNSRSRYGNPWLLLRFTVNAKRAKLHIQNTFQLFSHPLQEAVREGTFPGRHLLSTISRNHLFAFPPSRQRVFSADAEYQLRLFLPAGSIPLKSHNLWDLRWSRGKSDELVHRMIINLNYIHLKRVFWFHRVTHPKCVFSSHSPKNRRQNIFPVSIK